MLLRQKLEHYDIDSYPGSSETLRRKDLSKHNARVNKVHERAKAYIQKLEMRMINRNKCLNPAAAQYRGEDKVLIRLRLRNGKITPKRGHLLSGKVIGKM